MADHAQLWECQKPGAFVSFHFPDYLFLERGYAGWIVLKICRVQTLSITILWAPIRIVCGTHKMDIVKRSLKLYIGRKTSNDGIQDTNIAGAWSQT